MCIAEELMQMENEGGWETGNWLEWPKLNFWHDSYNTELHSYQEVVFYVVVMKDSRCGDLPPRVVHL